MALFVWPSSSSGLATEATLASVLAELAVIDGHVDGLETHVTSTNTKLDTLHTDLGTIDGHVDQIEGYVDGIETALGKIRAWPYATYAKIIKTSDATYNYYTYKTSGDVVVGTITETIATGDVNFSPDKAV